MTNAATAGRCISALLLACLATAARGQSADGPQIVGLRAGFNGVYKTGLWTPMVVTLRAGESQLSCQVVVTVPDADGVASQVATPPEEPVVIEPGVEAKVPLYVRCGRRYGDVAVEAVADGRVIVRRVFRPADGPEAMLSPALPVRRRLVVALAEPSLELEQAFALAREPAGERTAVVYISDLSELPDRWYGYEAVSAVVLAGDDASRFETLSPGDLRVAALAEWVHMGGELVISAGENAEKLLAAEGPLAVFSPGRVGRSVRFPTSVLEAYANSSTAIPGSGGMRVPQLTDIDGRIELAEGSLPLVIRRPYGFGQIVFFAGDINSGPLGQWQDRGMLLARLLGLETRPGEQVEDEHAVIHFGFTDMAGQLRSALDRFEGVSLVPFSVVIGLVLVYLLLVGPGDYFLLKRLKRRMELTWVTFPLIVAAVCVVAWLLAVRYKGDTVRVNQVEIVDLDAASHHVRGTAWANVFSPSMDRYNLSFAPRLPDGATPGAAVMLTSWLGLPGEALGGMDPKTTNPTVWRGHYAFSPQLDAVRGVPIPIWSTKSFTGRWSGQAESYPEAELRDFDGLPSGTLRNPYDFPLVDCLLVYGPWAYTLETLEPGEVVEVGAKLERRELKTLLTGTKMIVDDEGGQKFRQQATPYALGSTDPDYILRAMTFFEAAGGRRYTGLSNRYQSFVDLSNLLKTGRAILLARAGDNSPRPGAELVRDGRPLADPRDRHATLYRFVLPVKQES